MLSLLSLLDAIMHMIQIKNAFNHDRHNTRLLKFFDVKACREFLNFIAYDNFIRSTKILNSNNLFKLNMANGSKFNAKICVN